MERADLLYSGLMFAAGMLSVWTALLLTAAFFTFVPRLVPSRRNRVPTAATISSTRNRAQMDRESAHHGAKETTPPRSVCEALPQQLPLGRRLRFIEQRSLGPVSASLAARR